MIADKVWVWLTVTLGDLIYVSSHQHVDSFPIHVEINSSNNYSIPLNDSIETTFHGVVDVFLIFLEPFFIEFLTISIGVLFHMWHMIGTNGMHQKSHNIEEDQDVEAASLQDYRYLADGTLYRSVQVSATVSNYLPESEGSSLLFTNRRNLRKHSIKEKLMMGIYIIFIVVVTLGNLFSELMWNYGKFHELVSDKLSDETQYCLYRGMQIFAFFPLSIAAIVSTCKTYQENPCWLVSFTSSDYLLFFTAAANFVWYLLKLIAEATVLDI